MLLFITLSTLYISEVNFVNNKFLKSSFLEKQLSLKGEFSYVKILIAKQKLENIYKSKGFFDFKVKKVTISKDTPLVNITFYIDEGKRYRIKYLILKMEEKTDTLQKKLKFYDENEISFIEYNYVSKLKNKGFPFAEVSRKLLKDTVKKEITVICNFKKGKRVLIKSIIFKNRKKISSSILKKCLKLRKGDYYSEKKLRETLEKMYNLGVFKSIRYKLLPADTIENQYLLIFILKEKKWREFILSFGLSLPFQYETRFSFNILNLFGNAQKIFTNFRFLFDKYGILKKEVNFIYSEPYFLGREWEFRTKPFWEEGMGIRKYGLAFELLKKFKKYSYFIPSIQWKNLEGKNFSSFSVSFFYDTRNNFLMPSSGVNFYIKTEQTGLLPFQKDKFNKIEISVSNYIRISKSNILAYRIAAGTFLIEKGTISLSEKFRLGGDGTVRGKEFYSIGPEETPNTHCGKNMLNINLSLRNKLFKYFGICLFSDLGSIWNRSNEFQKEFIISKGIGIRFYIKKVIPLRLDIATADNVHYKIHLGIGEMF